MRSRLLWFSAASLLIALSGCAKVGTTTDIKADGSFTRTVVYRGSAPSTDGFTMGPTLDDIVAPPRTPGWQVTRAKDPKNDSELVLTATKAFAPGETLTDDLALKAPPKKDAPTSTPPTFVLGNTVAVTKLPNGTIAYRETIRWRGPRPSELATPDPTFLAALSSAVPALDKAGQVAVEKRVHQSVWQALFGPGEPLIGLLMTHPELGEFRLKRRLSDSLLAALQDALGNKLTEAERRAAVQKLVTSLTDDVKDKTKKQVNAGPSGSGSSDDTLVALLIKARFPGKVLQTNGELDPATGEVIWGLFSQAAAAGDVVLTAVCEPEK
ncbi:hypothetical protein [Armatimonas rosea]|uniref:Lipoprotein n=1 Tax=Armatimonas rosea TaxID=685828 RepID=A0A7W9SUM5_ARMRO|nr:hypothetical protein [Armatimonas rosea]MBB6053126.1 hypothetical protein [Armatimonas rosea]